MGEIYIDCHPVGTDEESILLKKKKVSFDGGIDPNNEEFQIIAGAIVAFGVLSVSVFLGRKYFFTNSN
jgi:hypothetical protein|tara:strand:+ start:1100 stop:1303 length:204 start_codon:yes stop_codon:yes gene_type:complete